MHRKCVGGMRARIRIIIRHYSIILAVPSPAAEDEENEGYANCRLLFGVREHLIRFKINCTAYNVNTEFIRELHSLMVVISTTKNLFVIHDLYHIYKSRWQ